MPKARIRSYDMLKGAVVRGPSIVLARYQVVTKIRGHEIEGPRPYKNFLGNDANAFYLSTNLKEILYGEGRVIHYMHRGFCGGATGSKAFKNKDGRGLGFAEVQWTSRSPETCGPSSRCVFHRKDPVAQDIQNYLRITGRKRVDCKKLLEALSGEEMLVNASLLQRYEHQGAVGLPNNRLPSEEELTLVRGTGDIGPPGGGHGRKNKTLLAEVFKLPRKSGYGKLIEVIERQTNIIYTNDK